MNEQTSAAPAPAAPAVKKSKKISIAAIVATVILLLAALFFAAVDFSPVQKVSMQPDQSEQAAWARFMSKIFISINRSKQAKAAECTFVFAENELNAALNMALRNYELKRRSDQVPGFAQVKNGILQVAVSIKKAGMYLNISVNAVPSVVNGKVAVKVKSAQLGMLPLPANTVEKIIMQELDKKLAEPQAQIVLKLIRSAGFTPENQFKLVVDHKAARKMF